MRAAEAAVAAARLNLQFTEVRAPIDGRAGRALVTAGNLAQADATLLTTVVSLDPMYVYFDGDEQTFLRYAELARKGERDGVAQPGARRPRQRGRLSARRHGRLRRQPGRSDDRHDPRARRAAPMPTASSRPGLFARVQLQGSGKFKALLIDDKAVLTDQDRKYVYVLGAGQHRRAQGRRARPHGRRPARGRSPASAPSDKMIVDGVQKIFFPGMPVHAEGDRDGCRAGGRRRAK